VRGDRRGIKFLGKTGDYWNYRFAIERETPARDLDPVDDAGSDEPPLDDDPF